MPNKVKIPKKIAGVKLPKRVRKKAKNAIKAGAGPVVREIAAAALGAAHARANVGRAGTRIEIDGGRISEAIRTAAIEGLRRFLEGLEEGLRETGRKGDDPQPDPKAKPRAARKAKKAKSRRPSAKPASRAPGV